MKRVALLALLVLAAAGCRTPAAPPLVDPLGGAPPRFAPIVPDALDHAAADLAAATLGGDPERTRDALGTLERIESTRTKEGGRTSGVIPAGIEAANAVLHPGRGWLEATEELLERDDLDDAARERLERTLSDDPLRLARDRVFDARYGAFARLFNAVSEPVGRSILNSALLPYTLGGALARYAIRFAREDPLPLPRRQALAHWERFRREHPDSPEAAELGPKIEAYREDWKRTRYEHALERAEDALDAGRPDAAVFYARRALRHAERDEAREIVRRAEAELAREHRERSASLEVAPDLDATSLAGERRAVLVALGRGSDADVAAPRAHTPEQRFARASTLGRAGHAAAMWHELEALTEDPESPMARHAAAALLDPVRHPHAAFVHARRAERWRATAWVLLGPLIERPDTRPLGLAEYVLDLPLRVQGAALFPLRLLALPWREPTPGDEATAVHARRALELGGDGGDERELREWLVDFEQRRGNWVGALRVAESAPAAERDDAELDALREQAAEQALRVASREERRDLRRALLANVARSFAATRAGREAGRLAREQAEDGAPHEIRISAGFLAENPVVAGPDGLDLAPELLDGDPANGELHPEGVALLGGRVLEVAVLATGGDDEDEPERIRVRVPPERLARLVARLEETSFRNALLDEEDPIEPDPQRDAVFERARLGLADEIDPRATSEARYAYRGMRERYGMVRSRESILPFELVLQGSLVDLQIGAFPRLRLPRRTPDSILYRE